MLVFTRNLKIHNIYYASCSIGGETMKKKKVLAVLVALLLVVGAGVYTYARYTFSRTGSGEVSAAKWTATVKQGGTAVTTKALSVYGP